jgi:hypothetical protein
MASLKKLSRRDKMLDGRARVGFAPVTSFVAARLPVAKLNAPRIHLYINFDPAGTNFWSI